MCLTKILFIEIMNNWIRKQNVFGERKLIFFYCLNRMKKLVFFYMFLDLTPVDKKPIIREICWHQLLINFILIANEDPSDMPSHFEEYKVVFQSTNNLMMTDRYIEYIKREIPISSIDFDNSMYNYCISLIRLCFRLAREHKSNEYAYLSEYLILALQAIGIEKELNDISIDIDT